MWPQFGYDGTQSGNNASNHYVAPVMNGTFEWSDSLQHGALGDGSEFCADSKGNVYYQDDNSPGSLYKFAPDGSVIWKRDGLTTYNFSAISMNKEETRIYFHVDNPPGLYCYDSSGNQLWSRPGGAYNKVMLDGEGLIYTYVANGFSAVNPDGSIKWTSSNINSLSGVYNAMDHEGNIYLSGSRISKLDKYGTLIWQYTLDTLNSYVIGIVIDGFNNLYFTDYRTKRLYSLDKDGNIRWKRDNVFDIPVISSDNIIFVQSDSIRALDINGKTIWSSAALENHFGRADNIILDNEDNLYYLVDTSPIFVCSLTKDGIRRWTYRSDHGSTLPNPVLTSIGKLIFAPKRGYKITCIN